MKNQEMEEIFQRKESTNMNLKMNQMLNVSSYNHFTAYVFTILNEVKKENVFTINKKIENLCRKLDITTKGPNGCSRTEKCNEMKIALVGL